MGSGFFSCQVRKRKLKCAMPRQNTKIFLGTGATTADRYYAADQINKMYFISLNKKLLAALVLLSCFFASASAQQKPNVYINCATVETRCFRDYLFQTISNCNFVWDQSQAEVIVLVTEKPGSTGGKLLTIEFTGANRLKSKNDTLTCDIPLGSTDEFTRTHICSTILRGLQYMFHHTQWQNTFASTIAVLKEEDEAKSVVVKDKWDYWNFTPGMNGWVEGQSNALFVEWNKELTARRITDKNKFILNLQHGTKYSSYTLETGKISININKLNIIPLYVLSIHNKWSAGLTAQYQMDEYKNIKSSYRFAPVIEYNIFPYSMNAQKQLRLVYQAGIQKFSYNDTTLHNKTGETRPYSRFAVITDINRNWGSIRSSAQVNSYLDNIKQYRVTFNSFISLRIAKGLNVFVDGRFEIVNDQISLLKNELSDNVYLLGGHQLPTKNYFQAEFGVLFTFGSLFSNIVNPRMGQIDEIDF